MRLKSVTTEEKKYNSYVENNQVGNIHGITSILADAVNSRSKMFHFLMDIIFKINIR